MSKVKKKVTVELELTYDPQSVIFMMGGDFKRGKRDFTISEIAGVGFKIADRSFFNCEGNVLVDIHPVLDEMIKLLDEKGKK